MTTTVSIDKVYEEIKRMRQQLTSIESSLDILAESLIPQGEALNPDEVKELETLNKEAKEGQCIPLEEAIAKHEGKKLAKIQSKRPQKSR